MAGSGGDAGSSTWLGSEDDLRATAGAARGELHRGTVANAAAQDPAVASGARTAEGSDVPAAASARGVRAERLHVDERAGDHHRGRAVRASAVSLRVAVLALGDGDGVLLGVVRVADRRLSTGSG